MLYHRCWLVNLFKVNHYLAIQASASLSVLFFYDQMHQRRIAQQPLHFKLDDLLRVLLDLQVIPLYDPAIDLPNNR